MSLVSCRLLSLRSSVGATCLGPEGSSDSSRRHTVTVVHRRHRQTFIVLDIPITERKLFYTCPCSYVDAIADERLYVSEHF